MNAPSLDLHWKKSTFENGFTQSELSLLDECALKWNFRYNNLLKQANLFQWNFYIGDAWHKFQETWRKSKGDCDINAFYGAPIPKDTLRNSEFEEKLEYWTEILPTFQESYVTLYKEEAKHEFILIEEELSTIFLGFKLRGKIDLVSIKPKFIRDFKTTSSAWFTSPDGWHFKLQFMFYCWLMRATEFSYFASKPFQFQLDMMQKPTLKQTKADGTLTGHIRRVKADIKARPEFYHQRSSYMIEPGAIQRFEEQVLTPKLQNLALVRDNPKETLSIITNPNTNACNSYGNRCEFYDICEKGWDVGKFFFINRKQKHEELI